MPRLSLLFTILLWTSLGWSQDKLSVRWEELTAAEFRSAIERSQSTCLLPFGILEKHGPHLPLGTDLLKVRSAVLQAAEREFAVVFPEYYFGRIFEAKHEPGTIAYSTHLQLELLQETTDEMARHGCKKIVIVNGQATRISCPSLPRRSSKSLTITSSMFCRSSGLRREARRTRVQSRTCTRVNPKHRRC